MNQGFRFNNPKQFLNLIILVSFCLSHLAIKISTIYENLKNRLKIQKSLCITTKTCTQIEKFKCNFLENYNDSEHAVKTKNAPFYDLSEYIVFFHMIVTYRTSPLKGVWNLQQVLQIKLRQNIIDSSGTRSRER